VESVGSRRDSKVRVTSPPLLNICLLMCLVEISQRKDIS
jgi:hypothetical protein